MDVIFDHSKGAGEPTPARQFDHRIRWGNVALALAALVAIVAAIGLPRGEPVEAVHPAATPVTELVTESVPTAPTAEGDKPRRHRGPRKRQTRKHKQKRHADPSPAKRPIPVAPAPAPDPAPAPPAPDPAPAAEREFGL
ncbi:MAG: hypothetical protein JHC98_09740 [Thermoleophilaceae bacterium]|nr:hypothetical protein [Thermoleophilaceae bacterium]